MANSHKPTDLKRRGFLRALLATLAGLLALGGGGFFFWQKRRDRRKPNIVFIIADDLGYGDLGSYGQKRIKTPNLDALAAGGMRFTQAYAGSAVCAPSRCCLMTGLHTGHARIRNNKTPSGGRVSLLPEDFTVAKLLKEAGYFTGLIGKWGMQGSGDVGTPNQMGFDEFFGHGLGHIYGSEDQEEEAAQDTTGGDVTAYYPGSVYHNGERVLIEGNLDGEKNVYSQDLYTQEALKFIDTHRHEPFFLKLSYKIPHANETEGDYEDGSGMEVPSDFPYRDRDWPQVEKNFAAMITRLDSYIGDIVSHLKELGLDKHTVVFFTSDNGPHQEGGHKTGFFKSNDGLRGLKRYLYEGGIRVPMIAWWPGTIEAGVVSDQVWAFWDFLPTASDLAEAELPTDRQFDGISMLPALLGKPQQDHDFLYWERPGGTFRQAVRMGNWKAIREGYDSNIVLFNLNEDIKEKVDVAAGHPDIVAEIARIMESEHTESEDYPIMEDGEIIAPGLD